MTLVDLLAGAPEDVAVYAADAVVTRRELRADAEGLAADLAALGVRPGMPVTARLGNEPRAVAALFGVWQAGAVHVPVNPRLTPREVEALDAAVRPAAVIDADGVRLTAIAGPPVHDADIALVQLTSGTTGRPKPVLLRHSGVLALLDGVLAKLGARAGGRDGPAMPNLVPVPLSTWAGIYQVLFAFRVGAPVVLMERFDTRAFAALVRRFEIRSTVLPPAAMTMLADDEGVTDLAPLRYVRAISAPLSPLQARRFRDRFGITILNSYGQTEIGGEIVGWSAADAREHGTDKLGAVGRPNPGVEVRVDDDTGELLVRTPAMSAGYADGADLADRLTPDGWFRTGDVGRVDDDGFVWIDGRVSDMVNRGGLKVFPAEVEEVLRLSPAVRDAAVAGVTDERLGEVPWAFVVPGDEEPDAGALDALCRAHLAPYKVPARFVVVPELPRNDVGKVLKRDLVERSAT